MATTSIWKVAGWIGKVLNYADDPEKTALPEMSEDDRQSMADSYLRGIIEYRRIDSIEELFCRADTYYIWQSRSNSYDL